MLMTTAAICLAMNVYFESRGESYDGQMAVAEVTMNRVASSKYPNDVCSVVKQRKQFSWYKPGKDEYKIKDEKAWEQAMEIANLALDGLVPKTGAMFFHAHWVNPRWAHSPKLEKVQTIGVHTFYKYKE